MNILEGLKNLIVNNLLRNTEIMPGSNPNDVRNQDELDMMLNARRNGNPIEDLGNWRRMQEDVANSWPQPDWEFEDYNSYRPGGGPTQGYVTGQGPMNLIPDIGYETEYRQSPYMPQKYPVGFDFREQFKKRMGIK